MISVAKTEKSTAGTSLVFTKTWNHEVYQACSLLLVAATNRSVTGGYTPALDYVKFNGIEMTLAIDSFFTNLYNIQHVSLWYVVTPAVGTYAIEMSASTECYMAGLSATLYGTHPDDPIYHALANKTSTGSAISSTLNTIDRCAIFSACGSITMDSEFPISINPSGAQSYTRLDGVAWTTGGLSACAIDTTCTTPTQPITWNTTQYTSYRTVMASVALRPANVKKYAPVSMWL